ncbi:hypothetical protein AB7M70_011836 [Bradyrhizobium japonicum]
MGYKVDAKLTTNYCFSLDIQYLKKQGYFVRNGVTNGTLNQRFRMSGRRLSTSITCEKGNVLRLKYDRNGNEITYSVRIVYSKCNYGGERPWFICPNTKCNKRVGKLFLVGDYYLCRHCHDLAYETQNMTEPFRMLEKAQNIRERLGAESLSTIDPFPPRPKGMHHKTYKNLRNTYDNLLAMSWGMAANK